MTANYSIIIRPYRENKKPNFIIIFNWHIINEVDIYYVNDMQNVFIPRRNTVAIFKIKWK